MLEWRLLSLFIITNERIRNNIGGRLSGSTTSVKYAIEQEWGRYLSFTKLHIVCLSDSK